MTERTVTAVLAATALALLAMGWCLTQITGARVVGAPPSARAREAASDWEFPSRYADRATAAAPAVPVVVPGRFDQSIALVPSPDPVALALVAALLDRERARTEPRYWTLERYGDLRTGSPTDARPAVVVLVQAETSLNAGTLAVASIGAGRAAPPWLRRVAHVAGTATGMPVRGQTGWAEVAGRAGVAGAPGLGRFLRGPAGRLRWMRAEPAGVSPVPAVMLRVGVGHGGDLQPAMATAWPVLLALVDQLQTEPALRALGPDQFGRSVGRYLTPGATRWLWVFPLVPLTVATGARYGRVAAEAEFIPAVLDALRRIVWWCVPCVGGAGLLVAIPVAAGAPLSAPAASGWVLAVAVLGVAAQVRARRVPRVDDPARLGGALVLDILWSSYLVGVIVRPWGTGLWLAPAVVLWPWVVPATGPRRAFTVLAWLGGAAPAVYWLTHVPAAGSSQVLASLGWLAGVAPPGSLLLGGFVTAAGLQLAWWAATAPPLPAETAAGAAD